MERIGRGIIVGAANGLCGAVAGSAIGFAVGFLIGLFSGDFEVIPGTLLGCGLGAVTLAGAAVIWDNGEQIFLFSREMSAKAKTETDSARFQETASAKESARGPRSSKRKPAVLFLCAANSARSQMAEAFLKQQAGDSFEVLSAGLVPRPIHPLTFAVMKEVGIDLSGNRAKDLREFLGKKAVCCAITVCQQTENGWPRVWPGARSHLAWPFDDPAMVEPGKDQLAKFRTVRDQIREKIKSALPELVSACSVA